jgi:hypothetical protein
VSAISCPVREAALTCCGCLGIFFFFFSFLVFFVQEAARREMDFDDDMFLAAAMDLEKQTASRASVAVSEVPSSSSLAAAPSSAPPPSSSMSAPPPTSARAHITPRADFFLPRHSLVKRPLEEETAPQEEEPEKGPRENAHWVWPESSDFPRRDYQYQMVVSCLRANTLVCLPTGLGKTFVAAVVMYNFYSWHPEDKVGSFLRGGGENIF